MGYPRAEAVERVEALLDTIDEDPMPVPVREVWVYGDLALGLDPVDRLDVYLAKDLIYRDDPDREAAFQERMGVEGIGRSVRADWAEAFPEYVRANAGGHAAPERCLAAHLLDEAEPIHLEVCNASFEDNVTQRLRGAIASGRYERILDPRGVCLWLDGQRASADLAKLRAGDLVFPTLAEALEMLGASPEDAERGARAVQAYRERQEGTTVRADVV